MKKSVIALAVASAMPFAVQADTTITGNVSAKYVLSTSDANLVDKGMDVDSDLDISSTEVLANGMTATASFDVSSQAGGSTGKASLAGDFGTVTIGSALDADGAFQAGDVAGVVGDTTTGDVDQSGSGANAIHYSGSFSGLNLAVQLNAATTASFEASSNNGLTTANNVTDNAQTESSQVGLSYELMDGLTVGYSTANDALGDASGASPDSGIMAETSAFGIAYTTGAWTVQAGQQEDDDADGTEVTVKYAADNFSVAYNHFNGTDEDDVDITYDMGNGLSLVMEYDMNNDGEELDLEVTYATGDLSITVTNEHNKSNDVIVAYDMGNADLGLVIDDSSSETAVTYKVSF